MLLIDAAYLGSGFSGYQIQPGLRTVQGELCRAFSELYGCECAVSGCSRTDSGVHARQFYASVVPRGADCPEIPTDRAARAVNVHLPEDIAVTHAYDVPPDFHPRHDVVYKEYEYLILNRYERDPFLFHRVFFYPARITDGGFDDMRRAADAFSGRHDFAAFMAQGSKITDTNRNMLYCRVSRQGDIIRINTAADGFLYNMVRIIAGTLLCVSQGRIAAGEIPEIIASHDRRRAGFTAPPDGLYLNKVIYGGRYGIE